MQLDESDLRTLARTYARSVPSWDDRHAIATRAGLGDIHIQGEPSVVWTLLVDTANSRGQLVDLGRAATRHRPTDATLATMAAGLERGAVVVPSEGGPPLWAMGLMFLGAVGSFFVVKQQQLSMRTNARAPLAILIPEATPTPTPEPVVEPEKEELSPEEKKKADEKALLAGFGGTEICEGTEGYVYMGKNLGVKKGGIWRAPKWLNVRAAPPSFDTNWKLHPEVRCVLPEGHVVRMIDAPVPVQGGAHWAHVKGEWIAEQAP